MRVLVTGANGFVGRWLVRSLLAAGSRVVGTIGPGGASPADVVAEPERLSWVGLDLGDAASVRRAAQEPVEAVIHLAGASSGADSLRDPWTAWMVNAAGTARLLEALGERREQSDLDPVVIVVSTGEAYGAGLTRPARETDPAWPRSPYAASKLGAEVAAREAAERRHLRVVVVRAFPHTGPGQDDRFVVPAFARRLIAARRSRSRVVKVGNLEVTRDLLDVRDVVNAYVALLEKGVSGETYNVATGCGVRLEELFHRLAAIVGVDAIPEVDAELMRPADLPYLVGDATKLRTSTGWEPRVPLDQTLRDVVDAQAD